MIEIGAYLEIKLNASAIGGIFSYNPTLLDKEWPLWSAGSREDIQRFTDPDTKMEVKLKNSLQTTTLPGDAFRMDYMDLKTGKIIKKTYDAGSYSVTISNPAFTYNSKNNTVTVNPGSEPQQDGEMTIRWRGKGIAFSSAPVERKVALHWDNLRDGYYIFFNSNGGSSVEMINKKYDEAIKPPAAPTRQGYVFGGWYTDEKLTESYTFPATMPNADVLLYAKWSPATDTPYTVEHYQQEVNGSYPSTPTNTDEMEGTTDTTVTAVLKSYDGFTAPTAQQVTIRADGSAMVRYYYTRNSYTATFKATDNDSEPTTKTFRFGEKITAPVASRPGYSFQSWNGLTNDMTMPANDMTFTAQWTERNDTPYKVAHFLQDANGGGYTLAELETAAGTTGQSAAATLKTYENYQAGEYTPVKIAGNGSTVVEVKYDRKTFTLTYDLNGEGAEFVNGASGTAQMRFGASVPILTSADVNRPGYGFAGWYTDPACTQAFTVMPTDDLTVYAKWEAGQASYTVKHMLENPDDDGYTTESTENFTATAGTEVTPDVKTYENFTSPAAETVTVNGNGSTVVEYKYTRNTFTLTWNLDGGSASGSYTHGQVKHGASIKAPTPTRPGYDFAGWDADPESTMPTNDLTYTAKWTPATYTVTLNANGGVGTSQEIKVTYDAGAVTLPTTGYSRVGYTFDGWYANQSGTGTSYTQVENITSNMTLYAKWKLVTYTITYALDGGTNASGNPASYTVENNTITLKAPTRSGYKFKGWTGPGYNTPTKDNVTFTPNPSSLGDITFTAHWLAYHTVKLEWDGNAGLRDKVNSFGSKQMTLDDTDPTFLSIDGLVKWGTADGKTTRDKNLNLSGIVDENASPQTITLQPVWQSGNTIYSRSQLEQMRDEQGTGAYALGADLDMSQGEWDCHNRGGDFDGNGYTISNLNGKPLFNTIYGNVKNIIFNGANINSNNLGDAVLARYLEGPYTVSNVVVNDSTVAMADQGDYTTHASGIVGHVFIRGEQDTVRFENCRVSNTKLEGSTVSGGIVGTLGPTYPSGRIEFVRCTVENNVTMTTKSGARDTFGAFFGEAVYYFSDGAWNGVTISGCANNVTNCNDYGRIRYFKD